MTEAPSRLPGRYTLLSRIPVYLDPDGSVWTNALWSKDLERHFPYLTEFALCATVVGGRTEDMEQVTGLHADQVIALRPDRGLASVLRNVGPNFGAVRRAVQRSDIVHSGGAGWAFPLSFYVLVLRPFMRFRWVMVIESSFWMKPANARATLRQWITHHVHRILLTRCLRRADARIFTSEGYRRFFGISEDRSLVAPAVWVDTAQIIAPEDRQNRVSDTEVRLIFPARLVPDKGPDVVLAAIKAVEAQIQEDAQPTLCIDMIGTGPLADECRRFAQAHKGRIKVRFLDPVPYGAPFFELLRSYHGMVLANRQDEQPRVVFDAFSQAVPVIATRTRGICDIVTEDTALLYDVDDAQGLAHRILQFTTDAALRARMADAALRGIEGRSHDAMHAQRAAFLAHVLA